MKIVNLKRNNGFTLIELMIVIVIIGILVAIALPNFVAAQDRAKRASTKANMHALQITAETFNVDNTQYPPGIKELKDNAISHSYWKDFKNVWDNQLDNCLYTNVGMIADDQDTFSGISLYDQTSPDVSPLNAVSLGPGEVVYAARGSTDLTKYAIYGTDKSPNITSSMSAATKKANLVILKDRNTVFYLTNN